MLRFTDISKAFIDRGRGKGVLAVQDVDLSVRDSEFVCLIGPSGCGKSTLLNIAAGLVRPSRGRASIDGTDIKGPDPLVGMVFQEYSLFPWLSVLGNVEFGLKGKGMSKEHRREKALKMLEIVDLVDFKDARPSDLSGGMRQKVALARTLVMEPEIILMDEPFGALDEQARKHMDLELLKIWGRERKTVLFVTHNIEEAVMLSTRIVLMGANPGRIVREWEVGIPRPRDPFQPEVMSLKIELSRSLQAVLEECGCKRSETYSPIVPGPERTMIGDEKWQMQR